MYYPSKRRKVERDVDQSAGINGFQQGRERARSLGQSRKKEMPPLPKIVLPPHEDQAFDVLKPSRQEVESHEDSSNPSEIQHRELRVRHLVPAPANNAVQPPAHPITTMVAVDVSDGKNIVSHIVEPMSAAGTVNVPGFGEVNVTDTSTPPAPQSNPSNTPNLNSFVPGSVVPPAAVQASSARTEALQTQEAIAKELDTVSQAPANATPEGRGAAASQSPMNLGSSSQQVLLSPPTPSPSTPQSSAGSSSSYFSSNPSLSPTSSPSNTLSPNSNNSTMSATTSMGSSATTSSSLGSLSSQSSATAYLVASSTASQASMSSVYSMAAAASSLSGFATSTRSGQTISSVTTATPTSINTSASSSLASQSSASTASVASSTSVGAGGIGGSSTGITATPTFSSASGSGNSNAPPTPVLVGGIVGGVAGLAMVLLLILLFFRWRRNKSGQQRLISPPIAQTVGQGSAPQSGTMTQRSSTAPIVAGLFGRMRPVSSQTARTAATTDTAPSERGFQKISGRKIPSVLASGGDGYGDNTVAGPSTGPPGSTSIQRTPGVAPGQGPFAGLAPALRPSQPSPSHSLSGSSFYRDSQGFYGGVVPENEKTESSSSPLSSSPTTIAPLAAAIGSPPRRDEVANMRPGPARTPVINEPGHVPVRAPPRPQQPSPHTRGPPGPLGDMPRARDGLGRSHPSQDGSRGSRFREDTTPP